LIDCKIHSRVRQRQGRRAEFCLHDVPNHIREVTLQGVRRGAAVALAMAQVRSGHELRLLPIVSKPLIT
jgi:hypothetical protein